MLASKVRHQSEASLQLQRISRNLLAVAARGHLFVDKLSPVEVPYTTLFKMTVIGQNID